MKKFTVIFFMVFGLLTTAKTDAQNKTGYISVDEMVLLMPETNQIDSLLKKFRADSIQPQLNYIISEYQRKDSMYRDTLKTPLSVRKTIEPELQNLLYQIQNWDAIEQQILQNKQDALLQPIYKKVVEAVKAVAKEKGYSYVYNREALLVAPPGDDLLPLVAARLKVTVPATRTTGTGN